MQTRRDLVRLSLLGAPLLLMRRGGAALVKGKTQRLGLSSGRDGSLYVPSHYDPSVRAPALLFLHGAGGSGERAMRYLLEPAERTGTIVIAPDSRAATWGVVTGDERPDADFIQATLKKILAGYEVDARRLWIGGFSDGASAALSVGLVNGDLFSGVAAFSPGFVSLSAAPEGRPQIFISHGANDEILPVDRCGRRIARELRAAGYTVDYREFDGDHTVPDEIRDAAFQKIAGAL